MSNVAIRAENLSKQYRIGRREERYQTLRDMLTAAASRPFRSILSALTGVRSTASQPESIWAVKKVSFEIKKGEMVGIIGRNGAGKTTVLKILSRITIPTAGCAEIYGRVGSLLEVGTGFHPELTGRENVYLNGSIVGMTKAEIDRKFDEIVAFAEIDEFIDTPLKRYSSGMAVRLAFAVAAHLEPEILLVDEVLAVGDARFQKKCLGKMSEVGSQGRTVLFVSHNMPAVLRLCGRVILLDRGELVADGSSQEVVRTYLQSGLGTSAERVWEDAGRAPGDDAVRLRAVRVRIEEGGIVESIDIRRPVGIEVEYWKLRSGLCPLVNVQLSNEQGICLFLSTDNFVRNRQPRAVGLVRSTCWIPGNFLAEGSIMVMAAVVSEYPKVVHAREDDAVSFQVIDKSEEDGVRGEYTKNWPGVIRPMLSWTTNFEPVQPLEIN